MMSGKRIIALGLLAVVGLSFLLFLVARPPRSEAGNEPLLLYCAAGIKPPVLELAKRYESEYGVTVQPLYGGSGTLLSNIEASNQGDVFIAADQSYIDIADDKGLTAETLPLGYQRPVIAVSEGNPKEIAELEDLLRADVRVAVGKGGGVDW